jgi:hypothetical protein
MERSDEARRKNVLACIERNKQRYATDAEFRAKVIADASAWYYANRERVLERQRVKRRETG